MARPARNNVDYFPFYCEEGEKMFCLEQTYGNDGFAVFVKLLRELARKDYHYLNLSERKTKMFLAAKCRVSIELLESIINDLVDLGKFNKELWEDNSIIWCQDFTDSIQDAYKKRNNECITFEGLLVLFDGLGIRKLAKGKSKSPVKPQSKEENTIKENTKDELDFSKLEESKRVIFFNWQTYRKEIKKEIKNPSTLKALVDKINSEPLDKCKAVINASIENGWTGLFWDKYEPKKKTFKDPCKITF